MERIIRIRFSANQQQFILNIEQAVQTELESGYHADINTRNLAIWKGREIVETHDIPIHVLVAVAQAYLHGTEQEFNWCINSNYWR